MNYLKYFSALTVAVILFGCVRSFYPLFTEEDLIFDPGLIGTWAEKEGKNTWTFEKSGERSYTLIHYEAEYEGVKNSKIPGDTVKFIAQLGQVGKYYFLDIFPGKPDTRIKNGFYNFHLLPLHTFSQLWLKGNTLKLSMLDNDWLEKMIDNNAFKISHTRMDNQIILTASSDELQDFVRKYAENPKAFPKPGEFRRVK